MRIDARLSNAAGLKSADGSPCIGCAAFRNLLFDPFVNFVFDPSDGPRTYGNRARKGAVSDALVNGASANGAPGADLRKFE
jgi:hypothetical protein